MLRAAVGEVVAIYRSDHSVFEIEMLDRLGDVDRFERIKLAGLLGDEDLQMPVLAPASNAWGAREAWMKNEDIGPRELRGPLWETITLLTAMLAGGDIFMISHPATTRVAKGLVQDLLGKTAKGGVVEDWVTALG